MLTETVCVTGLICLTMIWCTAMVTATWAAIHKRYADIEDRALDDEEEVQRRERGYDD